MKKQCQKLVDAAQQKTESTQQAAKVIALQIIDLGKATVTTLGVSGRQAEGSRSRGYTDC